MRHFADRLLTGISVALALGLLHSAEGGVADVEAAVADSRQARDSVAAYDRCPDGSVLVGRLRQLERGARLRMVGRSGEPDRAWYVASSWRLANGQQVWQDFVRRNDEDGRWRQTFHIRGGEQTILVQARSRDERCGVRFDYEPGLS
jgi:hypothetical protein